MVLRLRAGVGAKKVRSGVSNLVLGEDIRGNFLVHFTLK